MLWLMIIQAPTLSDIAVGLNQDYDPDERGLLPAGIFMTDYHAVPAPEQVITQLPKGFAVIFRDYHHPEREILARSLRQLCHQREVLFLVAGDAALAEKLGADGVHLPEYQMAQAERIRDNQLDWLITVACHDSAAVQKAAGLDIDAGLIAPVFVTDSHPETHSGAQTTLGLSGVRAMVRAADLPLYALGGITKDNARQLMGTGVAGIAAIRGFCVA